MIIAASDWSSWVVGTSASAYTGVRSSRRSTPLPLLSCGKESSSSLYISMAKVRDLVLLKVKHGTELTK